MSFPVELLRQCRFLAGPTASGKTAVGIALARRINAEILALDSMTLYRRMDIGTAKATAEEQAAVRHHLLDLLEPWGEFTVADYLTAAETAVRDILSRGRIPLFVGGTGLYLRSLLRGLFDGPEADWTFRRTLQESARHQPPNFLYEELQRIDLPTAARLHPSDERRIIRALEIHHLTGQPASTQRTQQPLPESDRPRHVDWLSPPRDWLYERINARVDAMLAAGLVDEVTRLAADEGGLSRTARQALGYKEILDHLSGRFSLAEAVEKIKTRTRQFAKRQHTWFRNLEECRPLAITGTESPETLAERLAAGSPDAE